MKKQFSLIITIIFFTFLISIPKSFAKTDPLPPKVNSEAAILMESNSGKVLYTKNAGKEMYPASLTKIATAIYALEKGNLDEMVTVPEEARSIEGTRVYLDEGERVTLKKLLQGLLINSGNDAGVAIAQHLSGSVEQFAADLNEYYKGITGGKTGYVDESGFTLATSAKRNNLSLIVITLNSERKSIAYDDTKKLLDYGFNNFETFSLSKGKNFYSGDIKYKLPRNLFVTHPVQDQLSYEVSNGEKLKVINNAEDVQGIYPLIKINNKQDDIKYKSFTPSGREEEDESSPKASLNIFIVFLLLVVFCFIFYKTKYSKEDSFKRFF